MTLDLDTLRKDLDKVDNQIIELLAKRFEITTNVARYKFENNMEIFQPNREVQLLDSKAKLGNEFNLDEKFVRDFFQMIMNESKDKQKNYLDRLENNQN